MANEDLMKDLLSARTSIQSAIDKLSGSPQEPAVPVKNGDNILSLIANNPEGTVFDIASDFVQNVGTASISKPCKLKSVGAKLIGSLTAKAPDIIFEGLNFEGIGSTILTTGLRTKVDLCNMVGSVNGQQRGIAVNSEGVRIYSSKITNIWKDIDTQAICGANGTKDLMVENCELEASGENIMFGGADSSSPDMIPQQISISNCYLYKRESWKGQPGIGVKNLFELKSVKGLTMKNCLLEYSWASAQVGYGIVLTVRNQNGKAPWSIIENVILDFNTIRHIGGGVQILGRDDIQTSEIMNNVALSNNKFEDLNRVTWGGTGRSFSISGGPKNLLLQNNSFNGIKINSAFVFDQPQYKCEGLSVIENEFIEGNYGIFGTNAPSLGVAVLDMYAPGYVWSGNKVHKSGINNIVWPQGTIFV